MKNAPIIAVLLLSSGLAVGESYKGSITPMPFGQPGSEITIERQDTYQDLLDATNRKSAAATNAAISPAYSLAQGVKEGLREAQFNREQKKVINDTYKLIELLNRYVEKRLSRMEKEIISKEPTFERTLKLANEVIQSDYRGVLKTRYANAAYATVFEEEGENVVSVIEDIARLHPEYKPTKRITVGK